VNAIILVAMSTIMLAMNWKLGLIADGDHAGALHHDQLHGKILTKIRPRAAEVDSN